VPISGVQFVLKYDPPNLEYISSAASAGFAVNDSILGQLRCSVAGAGEIAQPFFMVNFLVHAAGSIQITGIPEQPLLAVDTALPPNQYAPTAIDGAVEILGDIMNLQFTVPEYSPGVPVPSSADGIRVFESDGSDPLTANVTALLDIAAPNLVGTASVNSNRGNRWYFARYFNEGGAGPAGPTTLFDTNVPPSEMPGAISIVVV
jgi:hypothetical protein